jgi:hypothetical protein
MNMTKWTEERRKRQAEAIRKWKPWEKSTGPKTEAGKARSSMNAARVGSLREADKLLRLQKAFVKQAEIYLSVSEAEYDKRSGLLNDPQTPNESRT